MLGQDSQLTRRRPIGDLDDILRVDARLGALGHKPLTGRIVPDDAQQLHSGTERCGHTGDVGRAPEAARLFTHLDDRDWRFR